MRSRKLPGILLAAFIAGTILAGCGEKDVQESQSTAEAVAESVPAASETEATEAPVKDGKAPVTLTLYGDAGNVQRPYMKKIFELYEAKTGNKLDVQGIESENFETVCLMKFQTGDIPDLFLHHGGYGLEAYNPSENFVDFTSAPWVADIQTSVLPITKRGDTVYGLPFWEASYSGLLYNKELFKEHNIALPQTQSEFNAVCETLVEKGIQPIYYPVKDVWPILYQYAMDPIFKDADLLNKLNTNQTTYAQIPQMKSMLEWYQMAAQKGWFGPNFASDTWDYCMEVLGEGEAAMMYCWDTWLYSDYDSEAYTYAAEDFGLMPAFLNTTENGTFEGPNCCLMLANKNSERVEAAKEFINFMADAVNYNEAFKDFQTAPVFNNQTTVLKTPQYEEAQEWIKKVGNASIANPEIIGFSNIDGAKCIQELMIGNIDVDECIKLMDEERIKAAESQQAEGFK